MRSILNQFRTQPQVLFYYWYSLSVVVVVPLSSMALRIDQDKLPVETKPLVVPSLDEIAKVLSDGLQNHFAIVDVAVVDCPDLRKEPFTLASAGLSGNQKLIEVGGPANLLPTVNRSKLYDITDMAKVAGVNPAFIIGAGAGPFDYEQTNCEGIYNLNIRDGRITHQDSKVSCVEASGNSIQKTIPVDVKNFGILANLFVSEGLPGRVVKVHVSKRTGKVDLITAMRTTMADYYGPDCPVGMGGAFVVQTGTTWTHVMPDFSATPLNTDAQLNDWLKFYNFTAPLICLGTFTTTEYGSLDLRVQHFHLFSHHGQAGHYHIDTTPETVEYLGYFNVADKIIRVDKPAVASSFGKD